MKGIYTIGELASASQVSTHSIRFYERNGLLEPPIRHTNGYRHYSKETALKVHFIKDAQSMGFTLKEIKELLEIRKASNLTCQEISQQLELKLETIEKKLRDLRKLKKELQSNIQTCHKTMDNECPVFNVSGYDEQKDKKKK